MQREFLQFLGLMLCLYYSVLSSFGFLKRQLLGVFVCMSVLYVWVGWSKVVSIWSYPSLKLLLYSVVSFSELYALCRANPLRARWLQVLDSSMGWQILHSIQSVDIFLF